ncbi:MAG TPA: hypothetical protein VMB47_19095 [Candidatus Aquilonibacter sp.]|nr:hypothetical protein [Candidatus Aquilonibacter sp.]
MILKRHLADAGEYWDIATGRKSYPAFGTTGGVGVVNGEAFADFAGVDSDNAVGAGVVRGRAAEDFDTDGAFFEAIAQTSERSTDDELQEVLTAFARFKFRTRENTLKFCSDGFGSEALIQTAFFHDRPTNKETGARFEA